MSIPPLVCSTPPPPEQCEDDKDHEDFDLSYNLSQEDDEDSTDYTYGNYSTYSAYQTTTEQVDELKWPPTLTEHTESLEKCSIKTEINSSVNITPISLDHVSTPKYEEAVLEDLNLIVDNNNEDTTDQDQSSAHVKIKDEINNSDGSDTDSRIIDQGTGDVKQEDLNPALVSSQGIVDVYFNEEICDKETQNSQGVCEKECVKDILNTALTNDNNLSEKIVEDDQFSLSNGFLSENILKCEIDEKVKNEVNAINSDDIDDDGFGDFEDFQITNTHSNQVLPITIENPWDSRNNESPSFTEFKASFDETKTDEDFSNISTKVDDLERDNAIANDEFGDFNDFKSSGNNEEMAETQNIITPNVSVWNLNSPDSELQIVDSISGLLAPIFTEEITEPENDVVGKLETFLSETWGHLIDIDVRQPYMINWNNSLGQKTLLKALCIDSRNILFGPKWHYNMPKYAANLTTAPLQPQKQVAHSSTANLESSEKINKDANTWVDPFTQDGQESCNTENESTSDPAKRPTDLDVFSGEPPADIKKIYSSTIKVQPVRHINLPDTHIFTPTDSETPRSKTIHYDIEPSPVPIPVIENKIEAEKLPSISPEFIENEYWEFQDFKGTTEVPSTNTVTPIEIKEEMQTLPFNTQSNQGITYQTQILQPIKMEPIMPTLNWPDPGEVKETFDNFSDFISNSTWSVDKENQVSALDNQKNDLKATEPKEVINLKSESIDDDFETFQSAPIPPVLSEFRLDTFSSPQISSLNINSVNVVESYNKPPVTMESKGKKIDNSSIKIDNKNSSFLQNSANDSALKQISSMNPGKHMNDILLPTNAGTSGINKSQQNSGQILQPLSLEGYSQINWPNPGIDLQDLSRFNPVDSVHTIKNDLTTTGNSKGSSPAHNVINITHKEISDDDIWGDFVSSAPKSQQATPKKIPTFADDDEWTDFVSSPSVKPLNGLSTISLNVHTNLNMQKSKTNKMAARNNQIQLDIPTLNYITPKSNNRGIYTEKHFQNL